MNYSLKNPKESSQNVQRDNGIIVIYRLNPADLRVRLGELRIGSNEESLAYHEVAVVAINGHPSFQEGSLFNDAAVLLLQDSVPFNQHIGPICLPQSQETMTQCVVSGWGQDTLQGRAFSNLRKFLSKQFIRIDNMNSLMCCIISCQSKRWN